MSKKLIGAEGFIVLLTAADEKTDLKALVQQVIDELAQQEQTIVVLKANIDEYKNKITELNNSVALLSPLQFQLEEANDNLKNLRLKYFEVKDQVDEYQSQLEELKNKAGVDNSGLQLQLEEAYEQISQLGKKLDLQEQTKGQQGMLVDIAGTPKMLLGLNFTIKKVKYTAEEVAKNPELLEHLHRTGSGSLVDPVIEAN